MRIRRSEEQGWNHLRNINDCHAAPGTRVHTDHPIVYPTLGLVNEAGELAGKVKKIFRDKQGIISEADREALKFELGDVMWYLAQIATELNLSLDEVAQANIDKLASRLERNQIQGEGDYR